MEEVKGPVLEPFFVTVGEHLVSLGEADEQGLLVGLEIRSPDAFILGCPGFHRPNFGRIHSVTITGLCLIDQVQRETDDRRLVRCDVVHRSGQWLGFSRLQVQPDADCLAVYLVVEIQMSIRTSPLHVRAELESPGAGRIDLGQRTVLHVNHTDLRFVLVVRLAILERELRADKVALRRAPGTDVVERVEVIAVVRRNAVDRAGSGRVAVGSEVELRFLRTSY